MGACEGLGNCWEERAWGIPSGTERPGDRAWDRRGGPLPLLSPCFMACSLTLQMTRQKHKVKMLCQVQVARPSAPKASTSLWAVPCPHLGHPSGLSLQGGAIQTWEGEAAGTIPTPEAGAGRDQLKQDPRPGLPPPQALHHTWVPLWTHGEQGGRGGLTYLRAYAAYCGGSGM